MKQQSMHKQGVFDIVLIRQKCVERFDMNELYNTD